jgi:RimJ/RimL family protein N-acetyltransferase
VSQLPAELRTERLLLRRWKDADHEPFAALNCDPRVREHFPALLSREESDASIARINAHFEEHGYGFWAVEIPGVVPFAGMVGLAKVTMDVHFAPSVETGWRLASAYWRKGYATEAAEAAVDFGFRELELNELVAMTVPGNARSRRVMEKLGMTWNPVDDFDHPSIEEGHPLRRCVLYRLRAKDWHERLASHV